jgi:pimeloyl-ACP methyl ester carboxylesterase
VEAPAHATARVLLVPGGRASVHGYFPGLAHSLATQAGVIEVDPPAIGSSREWRRLSFSDYAAALADVIRADGDGRVVVVGHSLGALVALQLAVQEPGLVAGLLLLDPAPLIMPRLSRALAVPGRLLRLRPRRRDEPAASLDAQPQSQGELVRRVWYLARDGGTLAAALRAGRVAAVPTVVVSAGEHAPTSLLRRTHEQLVRWIPTAELQVWEGTGHGLYGQRPEQVTEAVVGLLERTDPARRR